LRMHLVRPQDPQSAEFADLGEHSESCADVPPHRWFKASRALADGLLAVELRIPEGETAKALAGLASADLIAELERSVSRPVLDAIAERAEDRVIAAAAESLLQLLARPPLSGPVAGVVIDKNRIRVCVRLAAGEIEEREFGRSDVRSLVDWLKGLSVEAVGLARLSGSKDASGLLAALGQAGLPNEPVSQAGLMRQAREQSGDIKAAAAAVVAHRLQDPLAGTAGLAPDQLGLGEYLDRVDADLLKAALQDARDAATWLRDQGSGSTAPLVASAGRTLVRDLSEVRPGMELSGTVVNLTHFGAFVELGFPVQGLIHLSEFSERFVDHPSEVVRLGQQVRVKVLSYDAQRGRLSLTLRPNRPNRAKARDQRSAALGELDRLFRK
jgi:transcriptional accessory protein Tex/SPT6